MKRAWSSRASTLPNSAAREVTVEVRNEHRQRVLTVTVAMEIHRINPEPLPPRE
jgi:hypothetical protein